MKKKSLFAFALAFVLILSGCGSKDKSEDDAIVENNSSEEIQAVDVADMFSNRDYETSYDENESVIIVLNGNSASCDSDAVSIEGGVITITDEGTFIVRGTLGDGMLVVNAQESDKLQIVLDETSITSKTSAALYILEADKVFVTLADGTENALINGGSFEAIDDNNIDGAIFSKQDLTFNGNGTLRIESPADHGIVCKDDVVFTSGTYEVTSASHGIDANDSFRFTEASLTISSGKDGVHVENSDDTSKGFVYVADGDLNITAEGDGVSAGTYMQVDGGNFEVLAGGGYENGTKSSSDSWGDFGGGRGGHGGPGGTGGGQMPGDPGVFRDMNQMEVSNTSETAEDSTSMKGLKANADLVINDGNIMIDSADDGVHSNTSISINDGTLEIASGDDGVHAEDTLTVKAGKINITQSYEGLEALHIDVAGGDIDLISSDDGFNAAGGTDSSGMGGRDQMGGPGGHGGMSGNSDGTIAISGGDIYMNASGDGIDANGSLEISGGYVVVCGPTRGDTAVLDYDTSAVITGGTFIGTGSVSMAQLFSDAEQGVFAVQCSCTAVTEVVLVEADGKEIIRYTPELDFTFVCLSTPEIVSGEEYTISVGEVSGTFEAL